MHRHGYQPNQLITRCHQPFRWTRPNRQPQSWSECTCGSYARGFDTRTENDVITNGWNRYRSLHI